MKWATDMGAWWSMVSEVLRTEQAAEVLNVKRSTLEMWRCRGIGPAYVKMPGVKGAVRYHMQDLEQFLAQHRHVPSVRANMELIHDR
jgi:Helix-turn-helix domain